MDRWRAQHEREQREDIEFLKAFVRLPPGQRIEQWEHSFDWKNRNKPVGRLREQLEKIIIGLGADTAPHLAAVVRHGKAFLQTEAVILLCQMDRFVPATDSVLPSAGGTLRAETINLQGNVNPFKPADGHRVGPEAYDAVRWAAEQTGNSELRAYARYHSGLMRADVEKLSLSDKFELWKDDAKKSRGGYDVTHADSRFRFQTLKQSLVEGDLAAIPAVTQILKSDENGYIREAAIGVLKDIDLRRIRLRATEQGRQAIDAVRTAFQEGALAPMYKEDQSRKFSGRDFLNQVNADGWFTHYDSDLWLMAVAFRDFFGENLVNVTYTGNIPQEQASGYLTSFITYLTQMDPSFPSWEYSFEGDAVAQVLHPQFRRKMQRYHEQWKHFKTLQKLPDARAYHSYTRDYDGR